MEQSKVKIYKKTHTSKVAFLDHLSKIKERGMSYVVKGMTIHYGSIPKSKDTSIKARNSADLIKEAVQKGYRKVNVKFVKLKKSDFPASIQHLPNVKKIIGTQKISTFDVVD